MRAINRKNLQAFDLLPRKINSKRCIRNLPHRKFLIATFLILILFLTAFTGCAPTSNRDGKQPDSANSNGIPEITDDILSREINDVYLREVPEETGAGETISWRCNEDEPKEFTVVEKQINGDRATIIFNLKTQSAPGAQSPKLLAGQIRTQWKLQTGWALRTWELIESENISVKYKNLQMPPAQNSTP